MDEDGPNFSYAYGGAPSTPTTASWNPALRNEKEVSSPPVSSPPIIEKPQTKPEAHPSSEEEESEEEEEDDDEESDEEESEDEDEDEDEVPSKSAVVAPLVPAP